MKWNPALAISAVFALALTAVLAGQAHAGFRGDGHTIEHVDVKSPDTNWSEGINFPSHGKLWALDELSELGMVVTEADTEGAAEASTGRSCMDQFRASSASDTCENVTAEFHETDQFTISAVCKLRDTGYNKTHIEVSLSDTAKLVNCNGILAVCSCR